MVILQEIYFHFGNADFLPLLFKLFILALLLGSLALWRKRSWLKKYGRTLPSRLVGQIRSKRTVAALAADLMILVLLGLLVMQPTLIRTKEIPVHEKRYFSIWIDVSTSSTATDIRQVDKDGQERIMSRLEFSKEEVLKLAESIEGDYISVGIFADVPIMMVPPVAIEDVNRDVMLHSIRQEVKKITPENIRLLPQGSDMGAVIMAATKSFRDEYAFSGRQPKRIVIIITDGEKMGKEKKLQKNITKAYQIAAEYDEMSYYVLGVGNPYATSNEDWYIPSLKPGVEFEKDDKGNYIVSVPDFQYLSSIAERLKGRFIEAKGGHELMEALHRIINEEKTVVGTREVEEEEEGTFRWLVIAVLLLVIVRIILRNPIQ